jgi:hypothetical protein
MCRHCPAQDSYAFCMTLIPSCIVNNDVEQTYVPDEQSKSGAEACLSYAVAARHMHGIQCQLRSHIFSRRLYRIKMQYNQRTCHGGCLVWDTSRNLRKY